MTFNTFVGLLLRVCESHPYHLGCHCHQPRLACDLLVNLSVSGMVLAKADRVSAPRRVLGAFEGLVLIGIFFLCPETMYDRPASASDPLEVEKYTTEHVEHKEKDGVATSSSSAIEGQQDGPVVDTLSFGASLKLWSHFKPRDPLYVVVLRPFAVLLSPHIFCGLEFLTCHCQTVANVLLFADSNLAYTISFSWFVMTGKFHSALLFERDDREMERRLSFWPSKLTLSLPKKTGATYGQMYEGMYYQESVSLALGARCSPLDEGLNR